MVVPLVVYQGDDRWTSPVQLLDVIDLNPAAKQEMQAWLPRFEFLLDDLTRVGEDQLLARKLTPAALVTLRLLKTAPATRRSPQSCGAGPGSSAQCWTGPAGPRSSPRC